MSLKVAWVHGGKHLFCTKVGFSRTGWDHRKWSQDSKLHHALGGTPRLEPHCPCDEVPDLVRSEEILLEGNVKLSRDRFIWAYYKQAGVSEDPFTFCFEVSPCDAQGILEAGALLFPPEMRQENNVSLTANSMLCCICLVARISLPWVFCKQYLC